MLSCGCVSQLSKVYINGLRVCKHGLLAFCGALARIDKLEKYDCIRSIIANNRRHGTRTEFFCFFFIIKEEEKNLVLMRHGHILIYYFSVWIKTYFNIFI